MRAGAIIFLRLLMVAALVYRPWVNIAHVIVRGVGGARADIVSFEMHTIEGNDLDGRSILVIGRL